MVTSQYPTRILVIDNDARVKEDLPPLLQPYGHDVQVAKGVGRVLLVQAINLAKRFRPHVAIVDLRLLDYLKKDSEGIKLLEELRSSRCIVYSGFINLEVIRHAELAKKVQKYEVAAWVGKGEETELIETINGIADKACASGGKFRVLYPLTWTPEHIIETLFGKDSKLSSTLVNDLLYQLFPECSELRLDSIDGSIVSPHTVSRGRSVVLRLLRNTKLEPFVIKFARSEKIEQETQNYKEIEGNLSGLFYARLEKSRIFWDLGAAVYSFLHSPKFGLTNFRRFFEETTDPDTILQPLHHFFEDVWRGLYAKPPVGIKSLFSSYDETLELTDRLKKFPNQERMLAFPGLSISFLNPITWVLRHKEDGDILQIFEAITHGDLHGDNLFTDGTHTWAIDFERAGRGHILRDFVELEVDIITRLTWKKDDKNIKDFYRLVRCLAEPYDHIVKDDMADQFKDPGTHKAFKVVSGLRALAYDITRFSDFREYVWGLLCDTVFIAMWASEDNPQRDRALLYGSVLCSRLQHWGEKLPLEELPLIAESKTSLSIKTPSATEISQREQGAETLIVDNAHNDGKTSFNLAKNNIFAAGAFLAFSAMVAVFLWWAMSLLGITWQQHLATFIYITVFMIVIFTLLGLVKGPDALKALQNILSPIFGRGVKGSNHDDPKGDTNND